MKLIYLFLMSFICFSAGCSGVKYLGQVGNVKYYSVSSSKLDGPNINSLVSEKDGTVKVEEVFSGPGVLNTLSSQVVQAGLIAGQQQLVPKSKGVTVNVK